jgi:dienelactone hydrolase
VADDDLADFELDTFTHQGSTRSVYRTGHGPAVIVMSEIPGITPKVAGFARRVADLGCTAVMPHLFGVPGRQAHGEGRFSGVGYGLATLGKACLSREFTIWATDRTSPLIGWLRALAGHEHERCGGPGVGAVGMCLTGGFALAMATHPSIVAPVLSQPSLPFPVSAARRNSIDCSREDLDVVRQRCAAEGLQVLGLRFAGDPMSPGERFRFLARELGDAFVAVELDDASANPDATIRPHSVLTEHLIDAPGQPTREALDRVLELFRTRLLGAGPAQQRQS